MDLKQNLSWKIFRFKSEIFILCFVQRLLTYFYSDIKWLACLCKVTSRFLTDLNKPKKKKNLHSLKKYIFNAFSFYFIIYKRKSNHLEESILEDTVGIDHFLSKHFILQMRKRWIQIQK